MSLLAWSCTEHDGDERDDAFRQCYAERGQDRAHREGTQVQALAEPFHSVDEPLAGQVDHGRADDQQLAAGQTRHRVYQIAVTGWVLHDEEHFRSQPRQPVPAPGPPAAA
jgi:hypothetical protein